jgi:hypothetical protein
MPLIITEPLKVERLTIAIADLPASLSGIKIVQLSDLHYDGIRLSENLLAEAIDVSNQENPDLVVITGDFVTDDPQPIEALALRLKNLNSRVGIYGCLGNHDTSSSITKQRIIDALSKINIKILWNEINYPFGKDLAIVGLADFWSREFQPLPVFNQINPDIPRIVLSHNPDSAEMLKQWRVDLQLSGHTHGGQVIIPGYGTAPLLLQTIRRYTPKLLRKYIPYLQECSSVVKYWKWAAGLHQVEQNQLYINRGLGTYAPGRFFCPPEVTIITLQGR